MTIGLVVTAIAGPANAQRTSVGGGASGVSIGGGGSHYGHLPSYGHNRPGNSWGNRMAGLGYGLGYNGAGMGWGGGIGAWYPGYPNDPLGYETGRVPTPPYFAIHPPVYYGKRVSMPYGNSTVTRPPRPVFGDSLQVGPFQTPPQPLMIHNPYVEEAQPEAAAVAQDTTVAAVVDQQITQEQAVESKRGAGQKRRSAARKKSARPNQKARKRRG